MSPEDREENGEDEAPPQEAAGETPAGGGADGMEPERVKAVLEAVLYVSEHPLSLERLASVVGGRAKGEVQGLLDELNTEYLERGRAFEIVEAAGGFQVRTRAEFAPWIGRLQPPRPVRLSRAALESLAIVAYRQPVTRAEVESIRGVDTGAVLGSLLEKKLVRMLGRKEVAGRPILYGTSQEFLELFGLKNLSSLPTLKEIEGMFETPGGPEGEGTAPDGEAGVGAAPGQGGAPAAAGGAVDGAREDGERGDAGAGARPGGGEEWVSGEDAEDLETAELDALLRAAKTKVLSYEEMLEREGEGEAGDAEGWEQEFEGAEDEEDTGNGAFRETASWTRRRGGGGASRSGEDAGAGDEGGDEGGDATTDTDADGGDGEGDPG